MRVMSKILVTGFEPFGAETINPALEALHALPAQVGDAQIETLEVPVSYDQSASVVVSAIRRVQPNAIVCVGQAAGRADITVERVAINVDDSESADNLGVIRVDVPVEPEGPAAYFSTLPVREMVVAMREAGASASISNSAGTYVCNHLMYSVLSAIAQAGGGVPAGFIHVPLLPEQVVAGSAQEGKPSMTQEMIVTGLTAALEALDKSL